MNRWAETVDEELLAALSDAQRARNAIDARMLQVIVEIESRGLAAERGYNNTADLLQTVQRGGTGVAKARVRVARKTTPEHTLHGEELSAPMPATSEALACAEISFDHARVIERTLAALPTHLVAERAEMLERDLADHARVLDPDALRKVGKHALAMLDPDGPRPRDGAPTRNRLRLLPRGTGFEACGWFDSESTAILRSALSPLAAPVGAHAPGSCEEPGCDHGAGDRLPDPRSAAERDGDALIELARRMLQTGDLPTENGNRPQVTVTITLDDLRSEGAGLLEAGDGIGRGVIRAEDARRLACETGIIPLVLGSDGEPFDVGRRHRIVHPALRRALAVRDGGCAFPGCGIPARWTDAHHILTTSDTGPTAERPPWRTPCCSPRHHRLLHHGEWTVEIDQGIAWFHPPAWSGAPPGHNTVHRPDLLGQLPTSLRRETERVGLEALVG